jgi:ATP/maltotriose-dependent transcriptional regulator MalT
VWGAEAIHRQYLMGFAAAARAWHANLRGNPQEGIRLAGRTGQIGTLVEGYVALSRLRQARGDADGAIEAAREAVRLARSSAVGRLEAEAAAWKSRLHLARGEPATATSEWERMGAGDEAPIPVRELEQIARAVARRPGRTR